MRLLLLLVFTPATAIFGQRLVVNYYDVFHTKKSEELQMGPNGLGNGYYKKYNILGVLVEKGQYTNGKQTGIWTEYMDGGAPSVQYKYDTNGDLVEMRRLPIRENSSFEIYDPLKKSPGGIPFIKRSKQYFQNGKLQIDFEAGSYEKIYNEQGVLIKNSLINNQIDKESIYEYNDNGIHKAIHILEYSSSKPILDSIFYETGKLYKVNFIQLDSSITFSKGGNLLPAFKDINGKKFSCVYDVNGELSFYSWINNNQFIKKSPDLHTSYEGNKYGIQIVKRYAKDYSCYVYLKNTLQKDKEGEIWISDENPFYILDSSISIIPYLDLGETTVTDFVSGLENVSYEFLAKNKNVKFKYFYNKNNSSFYFDESVLTDEFYPENTYKNQYHYQSGEHKNGIKFKTKSSYEFSHLNDNTYKILENSFPRSIKEVVSDGKKTNSIELLLMIYYLANNISRKAPYDYLVHLIKEDGLKIINSEIVVSYRIQQGGLKQLKDGTWDYERINMKDEFYDIDMNNLKSILYLLKLSRELMPENLRVSLLNKYELPDSFKIP